MKLPKRIVILSSVEYGLAFDGMLHFRNKLIQQGRYTDAVDELLIKLRKARENGYSCGAGSRRKRQVL